MRDGESERESEGGIGVSEQDARRRETDRGGGFKQKMTPIAFMRWLKRGDEMMMRHVMWKMSGVCYV